jgi:replicative DNA helicase
MPKIGNATRRKNHYGRLFTINDCQFWRKRWRKQRARNCNHFSFLKAIAKELNVPVIALSQLSRTVETRPNKRPQLSDLRESGAIEQDADIVSFIYRPEYYKIEQWEDETPSANQAELIIAKHRNGSIADVRFLSTVVWQNSQI